MAMTSEQRAKSYSYTRRSNQPRGNYIRLEEDQGDDYKMAKEVAGQPATTTREKLIQQRASNTARMFEKNYPKVAAKYGSGVKQVSTRTKPGIQSSTVNKVYNTYNT
jgi:hypothetical protein